MDTKFEKMVSEIEKLKKERNAIIVAHYYVEDEVQELADYVGDSYYLAKIAEESSADVIVFCGVNFMGESAKIINPNKTIILPDLTADCPMAHMATSENILSIKSKYEDIAVACYINSSADLKVVADVCVTSSNAVRIIKALPEKNILFIPDENLGRFCQEQVPEKNFIFNDGYCPIHKAITAEDLKKKKEEKPNAKALAHPECTKDVLDLADFIGSTSEIINYATNSENQEFIIVTEKGILYELKNRNPNKTFYTVNDNQSCEDMKKITIEKILVSLRDNINTVEVDEELAKGAKKSLSKMLELAK